MVAVGRRAEPLAETAHGHPGIHPLTADITAEGGPEDLVGSVLGTYGRLDVLVNNAGIAGSGLLESVTADMAWPQLATNLVAPLLLAREALPALEASGGVIVNVSSLLSAGLTVEDVRCFLPCLDGDVMAVTPSPEGIRIALDRLVALDRRIAAQTEVRDRLAETIRAATGGRVRPVA